MSTNCTTEGPKVDPHDSKEKPKGFEKIQIACPVIFNPSKIPSLIAGVVFSEEKAIAL
jgi:hypothetical protein